MTVALVVATAAARDRVLGHLSSVTPNGTGQVTGGGSGGAARDGSVRAIGGGSGSGSGAAVGGGSDGSGVSGSGAAVGGGDGGSGPAAGGGTGGSVGAVGGADSGSGPAVGNAATPQVTAGLPLLGLLEGEVTAQPLLTRLCGQLGALGVRDIILIAPPSHADVLCAMAWDGLSMPGSLRGSGLIGNGNAEVIECTSVVDELRAVAAVAARVSADGDAIVVCAGDVVAHTEALARLCRASLTTAITAAHAGDQAMRSPDARPALRLAVCENMDGRQHTSWQASDIAAAGRGSQGCAVVAAGSAFHRVHAPNAVGCGVFVVAARDGESLAAVAEEFADLAGQRARAGPDIRGSAQWPASSFQPGFTDSPALLLVGLVRTGVTVEAVDTGRLVCKRAQTAQQARAAAAELSAVDEEKVRLNAAVRRGGGLLATCLVNPYAKHLARWAHRRQLNPNALTGMSISSSMLAAVWFSAGSSAGVILGAAFGFAAFVLACVDGQLARYARRETAFGAWLHAVGGRLAEYAIYAGLAAGSAGAAGAAGVAGAARATTGITAWQSREVWELAVAAMILQSLRDMVGICARAVAPVAAVPGLSQLPLDEPADFAIATPARLTRRPRRIVRRGLRRLAEIVGFRLGERVAVIGVTAIVAGARAAFLVLLACGLAAFCLAFIGQVGRSLRARTAPADGGWHLTTCRDDGIIAQSLGKFVNGQLPPLLPAVAGVTVTVILSVAGVAEISGGLVLAPVVVMALAALGSANPHHGRLDWLVPPLLQVGEYVFLAALAIAGHVPLPLLFALIGVIAAHRNDIAYRGRDADSGDPGERHVARPAGAARATPRWNRLAWLGWDGRMLAAALGAVLGIEVFAFAVLAVYLWVLFGQDCLTGWIGASHQANRVTSRGLADAAEASAHASPGDPASQGRRSTGTPRWPRTPGPAGLEDGGGR